MRYADDCNIYVASEHAGQRVMASLRRFIRRGLRLKVNPVKSAVGRPWERKFLGFSFTADQPPRRSIAPKALKRFKHRVAQLTRRARAVSFEQMVEELKPYLRGWGNYFGRCQRLGVLSELDQWVSPRLRCYRWSQWRNQQRRHAELRKRGLSPRLVAQSASSGGPWRASTAKALHIALPNGYFAAIGIPPLSPRCA